VPIPEYCRQIETYLCQKNDGHLIRVVGPSFDVVSKWAADGIPIKVAFRGIDRYFERYYRDKKRRRPVRIDFCEADVLDVFDEWRRAVGVVGLAARDAPQEDAEPSRRGSSLPAHLQRAVLRLTEARATGTLDAGFDALIDRVAAELDVARTSRGLRGEARQAVIHRLVALDLELAAAALGSLDEALQVGLGEEADDELSAYRDRMTPEAYARARNAAIEGLVRERFRLPTLSFP